MKVNSINDRIDAAGEYCCQVDEVLMSVQIIEMFQQVFSNPLNCGAVADVGAIFFNVSQNF